MVRLQSVSRGNVEYPFIPIVAERTLSHIFTQWGWRIPFGLDDFTGQIEFGESPPNYLFLKIFRTGRVSFCPRSYSSRSITPWGEPSNSWTFECTLLDQRFPVEYELDELIPLRQFSYFIPGQPFRRPLRLSPTANRIMHFWLNISFLF